MTPARGSHQILSTASAVIRGPLFLHRRPNVLLSGRFIQDTPMPNPNRKQQAHALIDKLPDNATWDK